MEFLRPHKKQAALPFRKASHFDLFFIPEDSRKVRRLRVSSRQLRLALVLFVGAVLFSLVSFAGFWRFHSLYTSFEKERRANVKFAEEKREVLNELDRLQRVVASAEKFADRLASLVGTERPRIGRGIGPVAGVEWGVLSKPESVSLEEITERIGPFEEEARAIEGRLQDLVKMQEDKLIYVASKPSIWPLKGWVTSEFGNRRSPMTERREFHSGVDIAAQWGTDIRAPAAGVVRFAGYKEGLGRSVIIDHGFGIRTYYGHTSAVLVQTGQVVKRGMRLARVGNSGRSTGPHLHYEVHVDGLPTDPMTYILQ